MAIPQLLIAAMVLAHGQTAAQPALPPVPLPPTSLPPTLLPEPTRDPLMIVSANKPILNLARGSVSPNEFLALVQQAVEKVSPGRRIRRLHIGSRGSP